jgi:hypothetical protein
MRLLIIFSFQVYLCTYSAITPLQAIGLWGNCWLESFTYSRPSVYSAREFFTFWAAENARHACGGRISRRFRGPRP